MLPTHNFTYDAFISYRQKDPDMTWVRNTLIPRLEAEGLRICIDYRDFRLGAIILKELERAVETSRYTLAILSPEYLNSNFAELENVMAQHLGLDKSQHRLMAVVREKCKPRLGIRVHIWLDMTDDSQFDNNISRLVYALQQDPNI